MMVFKNTYKYIYIYIYIYREGPGQSYDCLYRHLEYSFLKDQYGVMGWIQRRTFKMSGYFLHNKLTIPNERNNDIEYNVD